MRCTLCIHAFRVEKIDCQGGSPSAEVKKAKKEGEM